MISPLLKPLVLLGLVGALSACNGSDNTPSPPDASPTPTASPMPSPSTSPSPSPSVSPSPSPEPSPSVSPSPSPEPSPSVSPSPSPEPSPSPDPSPSPEPSDGFSPLANGVAYRFDSDKPEQVAPAAAAIVRAYVLDPVSGRSHLLTTAPAPVPGGSAEENAFAVVHFTADGARDTTLATDGVATVCGACPADHPYRAWVPSDEGDKDRNSSTAARLSDGSVLAVVRSRQVFGFEGIGFPLHHLGLVKLTPEGALDESFGDRGVLRIEVDGVPVNRTISFGGFVISREPDATGHLLVGAGTAVVRLSVEGVVDTAFGDNGLIDLGAVPRQMVTDVDGVHYFQTGNSYSLRIVRPNSSDVIAPEGTGQDAAHAALIAHPEGGVLHVVRSSPALPGTLRHMDSDGNPVAARVLNPLRGSNPTTTATDITAFRDVNLLPLAGDRLLFTASIVPGASSGLRQQEDVGWGMGLLDLALESGDAPFAQGCPLPPIGSADCAVLENGLLTFFRMPESSLRASGAVFTGHYAEKPDGGLRYLLEEVGSWVFLDSPTP